MENNPFNQDNGQGDQRNQNPSGNARQTQGLFGNTQGAQGLFGNSQGGLSLFGNVQTGQNLFGNTQGGRGLFGNSQGGLGLFGNAQSGQGLFGNSQGGLGLFGNAQRGHGLLGNPQGGLFSGLNRAQNSKQPIKELTEEEKAQYRMVSALPEPRYGQLLWQETKKNKIFTHLSLHHESPLPKKSDKDLRKKIRRIYTVQRRKDIKKDDLSARLHYTSGPAFPDIAKSLGAGAKHFRELEIKTEQHSSLDIMTIWLKVFHTADLSNIKTLKFLMQSWYVLEPNEGRFSILKSVFPNLENLQIIFRQMHGSKDIPMQDWTLNFVRKLRNLKALRIEFNCCGFIKDEHLGVIGKALQSHLNSLESLELLFEGVSHYITSEAIQHLWESINRIPNLKNLDVGGSFGQNKIDAGAFATLCDVINKKSATLLTLKIDGCSEHVGSDCHQLLCKVLTNILPRLLSLELKFVSRDSVSDRSLSFFGELLSNGSPSLTKLGLELGGHWNITQRGAKQLAEGMKKGRFPKMQNLVIYFHMTYKLTYYGLYDIAEAVPEAFPNLQTLRFSYSGSHAQDDAEVTAKAEQMLKERLPNLSEQYLGW